MSRKLSLIVLVFSLVLALGLMTGLVWRQSDDPSRNGPDKQLGIMVEVYQHIADDYVTTPNLAKVSDGGLHGLLASLDADSSYLDPSDYRAYLQERKDPPAGGVQAVISKRVGYADVVDVRPGGDAARAGLVRGDFIEAVEGRGTRNLSLEEIRRELKGAPGSTVTMSVVHLHHSDPVKVTITRVAYSMAPIQSSLQADVGVIQVPDFDRGRTAQVAAAVKKLRAQGARDFILDLRNCGAGTYAEAENTAKLFLDHGLITYLQGQRYPRTEVNADPADAVAPHAPLEVLANFGTFGPAEVAAAALQENGRAKVIGDHTFGEGSLQKLIPVGDGSAILLSVARYFSPKGHLIQDGITPDIQQVQFEGALPDMDYPQEGSSPDQPDLQMQKALALFKTAPVAAAAAR